MIAQIFSPSTETKKSRSLASQDLYDQTIFSPPRKRSSDIWYLYACGLQSYLCIMMHLNVKKHCWRQYNHTLSSTRSFPLNLLLAPNHFQPPLKSTKIYILTHIHTTLFSVFPWYIWHKQDTCIALSCTKCFLYIPVTLRPTQRASTINHNLDPETQAETPSLLAKTDSKPELLVTAE